MYHWCALCNDANYVRMRQVIRVLDQYMGRDRKGVGLVVSAMLSHCDSVDAPCYTDRHAANSDESCVFMSQQGQASTGCERVLI